MRTLCTHIHVVFFIVLYLCLAVHMCMCVHKAACHLASSQAPFVLLLSCESQSGTAVPVHVPARSD